MAENQPEPHEAPPPKWVTEYLAPTLNAQNQKIDQLAQHVARGSQPPPPPKPTAATPTQAEMDHRLLTNLATSPTQVFAEVIGVNDQRTEAKINERVNQAVHALENNRQAEKFWGEFWGAHPDLAVVPSEVHEAFARTNPNLDPYQRATIARDEVRGKLQWMREQDALAAQRQQMNRRGMAGAPGMGYGAPDPGAPDPVDEGQRTAQALDERRAWKSARSGSELRNDNEYHEQMRQIKLQRIRDKTRAA